MPGYMVMCSYFLFRYCGPAGFLYLILSYEIYTPVILDYLLYIDAVVTVLVACTLVREYCCYQPIAYLQTYPTSDTASPRACG